MPAESRIYWDANVLLSYIDGDQDRLPPIEELLRRSRAGEVELVTSTLTQVEVAFAPSEKEAGVLDDEIETAIDELWLPGSPIKVVELHAAVAAQARALMRTELAAGRSGLRASDGIHLATAITMSVDDFHTYDQRLSGHAAGVAFPVREPFTPQGQLPGT